MSLVVMTCQCGSSDNLARNFLHSVGYKDWLYIPIYKGKEKSKKIIETIPKSPEIEMLGNFLKNASKWVVILGYDGQKSKWADIAHNSTKSKIEAEFIVKNFGDK